jgi:hypothetical protein
MIITQTSHYIAVAATLAVVLVIGFLIIFIGGIISNEDRDIDDYGSDDSDFFID